MQDKKEIKRQLLEACLAAQQKIASTAESAMKEAQESANGEKGTMGDKFESFREQLQIDRDMYAKQYEEALQVMAILNKIDASKTNDLVSLGAVVISDFQKLFVSASIGQVKTDEDTYVAISLASPIYKIMAGKKKGETFQFRDKTYKISMVF